MKFLIVLCCLVGWGIATWFWVATGEAKADGEKKLLSLKHAQGREVSALQDKLFSEASENFQKANSIQGLVGKNMNRQQVIARIPELRNKLTAMKQEMVDLEVYIGKAYYYLVCLDEMEAEIEQLKRAPEPRSQPVKGP